MCPLCCVCVYIFVCVNVMRVLSYVCLCVCMCVCVWGWVGCLYLNAGMGQRAYHPIESHRWQHVIPGMPLGDPWCIFEFVLCITTIIEPVSSYTLACERPWQATIEYSHKSMYHYSAHWGVWDTVIESPFITAAVTVIIQFRHWEVTSLFFYLHYAVVMTCTFWRSAQWSVKHYLLLPTTADQV